MALLFASFATDILVAFVSLCIFIYWYFNNQWDYWKKRNIPYCKPLPFVGNFKEFVFLRKGLAEISIDHYKELEGHKLGGTWLFKEPLLLIRDPDIIKRILVRDFSHFHDRGLNADEEDNPLSAHLLSLSGSKWRNLRMKLTPTFTSGKMKMMYSLMNECAREFTEYLADKIQENEDLEIKEEFAKFATDVIGSCAFGLQFNSIKDPNSEFRTMGRKVTSGRFATFRLLFFQFAPKLAKYLNIRVPPAEISDFFLKAVNETIEYREKNNVKRNDFMQLLIDLKNKGKVDDDQQHDSKISVDKIPQGEGEVQDLKLTNNLLAAQAFIFFIAGFETSSTAMSFAVHELAMNLDIQEKLRNEIDSVLEETGGEFTYEGLQKMKYLDKVLHESLRKYPPVSVLRRMCTKAFREPDTGVLFEEGMRVDISVYALHHDPKYYPDPDRFDPERFSEEEKVKRNQYVYLPFGDGPRNCIGMRFGLLQSKLGLASLLSRFELEPCSRTPKSLKLNPRGGILSSVGGIWVRLIPRMVNSTKN